jgi:hypothetical protein
MQPGTTTKFRWDYTLACVLGVMAMGMVLLPPQTPIVAGIWLITMFGVGIYPALHLAEWALPIDKNGLSTLLR